MLGEGIQRGGWRVLCRLGEVRFGGFLIGWGGARTMAHEWRFCVHPLSPFPYAPTLSLIQTFVRDDAIVQVLDQINSFIIGEKNIDWTKLDGVFSKPLPG